MAAYDYRCRSCDRVFEVRRGVHEEAPAVTCPDGHDDVTRLWSAVSVGGVATVSSAALSGGAAMSGGTTPASGGGCCGGGCCG